MWKKFPNRDQWYIILPSQIIGVSIVNQLNAMCVMGVCL